MEKCICKIFEDVQLLIIFLASLTTQGSKLINREFDNEYEYPGWGFSKS